jgi:predicted CXXCH cytochrome family protein
MAKDPKAGKTPPARTTPPVLAADPSLSEIPPGLAERHARRRRLVIIGFAAVVLFAAAILLWPTRSRPPDAQPVPAVATFLGSAACTACHAAQSTAWQGSQHAVAMQIASDASVRGDFAGSRFRYGNVDSTFARANGRPVVRTDGPDGRPAEFPVEYTFGVTPLQQYLVELPGGRLQALSIAWDTRPAAQGGGRWFHLYPGQKIDFRDELHWTRRAQNWNFMCADCHSTDVHKNYDAASDTYETTWMEIAVGCEACHGPGSAHADWARDRRADPSKGLTADLGERRRARWVIDATSGNAKRAPERRQDVEIETCAPCHSRRAQIAEGWRAGNRFLDHYRPALLEPPLYYADGQQRDEVYIWGSFLQSRMYRQGVTCSDCHEPHGAKLRAEGNALCAQCHASAKYDAATHHHHATGSTGAQCANCHMPATTYMVIDPRRDHSLRVPRPDLTVSLGTPNACNGCHADRNAQWADATVRGWLGRAPEGLQRYASAFAAAERGDGRAGPNLAAVATDISQPPIARASALAALAQMHSPDAVGVAQKSVADADPLVRFATIGVLAQLPAAERWAYVSPLLKDSLRVVRIEAAAAVADVPVATSEGTWKRAAAEFEATQRYLADRPEARVALGTFYARQRRFDDAEQQFDGALALDPRFVPAFLNRADAFRAQQRDTEAERVLREGLARVPDSAVLHHALGLALVRLERRDEALASLQRATKLAPDDARFAYVYAVALNSAGRREQALAEVERGLARHRDDRDLVEAAQAFRKGAAP